MILLTLCEASLRPNTHIAAAANAKPTPKATKIFKLLGSEAPQHYINQANADQQPWYLRPNYDQAEILIDPDGGVRAGSKSALIERLTAHETAGMSVSVWRTTVRSGDFQRSNVCEELHDYVQVVHDVGRAI